MAVTIEDMQVDVQKEAAPASNASQAPERKEPMNFRAEKEMRAERELRLMAD